MKSKKLLVGLFALSWLSAALGQDAFLRLRCDGDSEGADVFVNNKLKGQCPLDLAVAEGNIQLQVVKNLPEGRYRRFATELFLAGGAMKRLDVVLDHELLFTPEGRKQEDARLAAAEAEEQARHARVAAAREAARVQAELDAPRIAAENEAARLKAQQEAVIAQQAAIQAAPGAVKTYMDILSTKGHNDNVISASIGTTYAPLFLPLSTASDLTDGKSIALTDPAVFGNPDSMVAKAMRLQRSREALAGPLAVAQQ